MPPEVNLLFWCEKLTITLQASFLHKKRSPRSFITLWKQIVIIRFSWQKHSDHDLLALYMIVLRTSWRTICLVTLLIIGLAALLHHIVQHSFEYSAASSNDNTPRIECAIDDYLASNMSLPRLSIPSIPREWISFVFLLQSITPNSPHALEARAPPCCPLLNFSENYIHA